MNINYSTIIRIFCLCAQYAQCIFIYWHCVKCFVSEFDVCVIKAFLWPHIVDGLPIYV